MLNNHTHTHTPKRNLTIAELIGESEAALLPNLKAQPVWEFYVVFQLNEKCFSHRPGAIMAGFEDFFSSESNKRDLPNNRADSTQSVPATSSTSPQSDICMPEVYHNILSFHMFSHVYPSNSEYQGLAQQPTKQTKVAKNALDMFLNICNSCTLYIIV